MATGVRSGVTSRPVELEIDSIAAGGDGVARDENGRVVFVPRTAPGDRVAVQVSEEKASYARAIPISWSRNGPDRCEPGCALYAGCGGCQLQHLTEAAQNQARRRVVGDALARIGRRSVAVPEPVTAGPRFGYRNRISLTVRRLADGVVAGYRALGEPDRVLDVPDCPLAEEAIRSAWRSLRKGWGTDAGALPAGTELRVTLRGSAAGRVALEVSGGVHAPDGEGEGSGSPTAVAEAIPGLESYHWTDAGGQRRRLFGTEAFQDCWGAFELQLGPGAFLQVNRHVADVMEAYLDDRIGPVEGLRMLDLYAGVGTRAMRWALAGAEAIACEVSPDAVACGRQAARLYGAPVRFLEDRVEQILAAVLPADVAVVNPPRAGLSRSVASQLAAGGVRTLAYVSCDAATLARDLQRLGDGWRLAGVQPFDAFPQTAHVETIAWLERSAAIPNGGSSAASGGPGERA